MGRKIGATLLGIMVALLVIAIVHMISAQFYPLPEGVSMTDTAAMAKHISTLPMGAFIFVLVAYALGTVAGVSTAVRIGRARMPGYLVGAALLAASIQNLTALPHPAWFAVANFAIVLGATYGLTRDVPPSPPSVVAQT